MAFVSDYIKSLLKKAGVNPEDEKFKVFFANEEMGKLDVPEEIATGIDTNLISLTAAKDNYGPLKNFYHAQALNGIDTNIEQLLEELGLGDDDKTELKLEKSTGKRVAALIKKVQAAEQKKANADKPDKVAIQKTIDDLNRQIVSEKNLAIQAGVNAQNEIKKFKLDAYLEREISKHKSVFDESLSPELRLTTLRNAVELALQRRGAKRDFDESGNLVLLRTDGTKYFGENHEAVDFPKFVEQALSSEKLLAVNKPANQTGSQQTNHQNGSQPIINGNPTDKKVVGQNPVFKELMASATEDFKNVNGVKQS